MHMPMQPCYYCFWEEIHLVECIYPVKDSGLKMGMSSKTNLRTGDMSNLFPKCVGRGVCMCPVPYTKNVCR